MPALPPDRSLPPVGRRGVLAWAGALALPGTLALTACDDDPATSPGTAPGATVAPPTAPAAQADTALLASVRTSLENALSVTSPLAASTSPVVARAGDRLTRLHRAHATELGLTLNATTPTPSSPAPSAPVPSAAPAAGAGTPAQERARILAAEARLQDDLVAAALAARSGGLAQLLASMAAAVAQQRAVLA